jgi:hypothetical protein
MATPMTVKLQIAVSSTDENGQEIKKLFLVDMNVESESCQVIGIDMGPCTTWVSSNDNESGGGWAPLPSGEVMPPQDPPRAQLSISMAA